MDSRLLQPLSRDDRLTVNRQFMDYALSRDGEADLVKQTLSHREEYFAALGRRGKPLWKGEVIDQKVFTSLQLGERPLTEASALAAWLVGIARLNEGEAWGVAYHLRRGGFGRQIGHGRPALVDARCYADLEEVYHTKLLQEIVRLFGVDFELRDPPWIIRQAIRLMVRLPIPLAYMLALAGELIGTVALLEVLEKGAELLKDHPAILRRVRELLEEILIDELGHVSLLLASFNWLQLRLVGTTLALLLGILSWGYRWKPADGAAYILCGVANYSFSLFPTGIAGRAFIPGVYRPQATGVERSGGAYGKGIPLPMT